MPEIKEEATETTVKTRKPREKKAAAQESKTATPNTGVETAITHETTLFDWKPLIPSEYVDISNTWLAQNGIDARTVTKEQKEELKERAGEDNLIIKLAGFKHLAHLRGLKEVTYRFMNTSKEHVSAVCEIEFFGSNVTDKDGKVNYFGPSRISGVANATLENTSYPFSMFLESMAENRAFIRAVKTAFNINILGAEELQAQAPVATPNLLGDDGCTTPQESLRLAVEGKGKAFLDLKQSLIKKSWEGAEEWHSFADVPSDQCLLIIDGIISKK